MVVSVWVCVSIFRSCCVGFCGWCDIPSGLGCCSDFVEFVVELLVGVGWVWGFSCVCWIGLMLWWVWFLGGSLGMTSWFGLLACWFLDTIVFGGFVATCVCFVGWAVYLSGWVAFLSVSDFVSWAVDELGVSFGSVLVGGLA